MSHTQSYLLFPFQAPTVREGIEQNDECCHSETDWPKNLIRVWRTEILRCAQNDSDKTLNPSPWTLLCFVSA